MFAFITGATSGIGLAAAKALAQKGYDLAIAARNESKLEEVKTEIKKEYPVKVETYVLDVRDGEAVKK